MDNSFQKQALDLVAENEALKAQVNMLLKACQLYGDGIDSHLASDEVEQADTIVLMTPTQCLNSVRASAIRDLARTECPVSGYIITSEESRRQMIGWADFQDKCNNE